MVFLKGSPTKERMLFISMATRHLILGDRSVWFNIGGATSWRPGGVGGRGAGRTLVQHGHQRTNLPHHGRGKIMFGLIQPNQQWELCIR